MLNVIFYSEPKTRTVSRTTYNINGGIETVEVKEVYHSPISYSCQTMTSANGLFFCDNDITFFDGSMISLTNANQMFEGTKIETVSHLEGRADFSSVTLAERMFAECLSLTSVKAKFTSLKDAKDMFYNCSALTEIDCEWTDNLSVTSGMFYNCTGLTQFNADLSKVYDASSMFAYTSLASFSGSLCSLTNGENMFYGCSNFTSFIGDLSSLRNADSMFVDTQLAEFQAPLTSLQSGNNMFSGCRLTPQSVMAIVDSLPSYSNGEHNITIGINCSDNQSEKDYFAAQAEYDDWETLNSVLVSKGWTVTWGYIE